MPPRSAVELLKLPPRRGKTASQRRQLPNPHHGEIHPPATLQHIHLPKLPNLFSRNPTNSPTVRDLKDTKPLYRRLNWGLIFVAVRLLLFLRAFFLEKMVLLWGFGGLYVVDGVAGV
jgi:hypothetical protein